MIDITVVAQSQGFIRRFLELDQEAGIRGADKALEYFTVIEDAMLEYRAEIRLLRQKLSNVENALRTGFSS